ncbi:hypothetical protein ACQE3E_07125 [Methylomonas sp. MED-D]|uniref:Uncharacterized protein n=1 Tax=Methylomonas koyamae TaxID=702114 RepID=A0A177N1K3_9GAMM|nr:MULTISPECIES: hypothetical protein [Methylomonas]MDT4329318.1 hypothetical protein [Methylomonas sp. MV1]OAI11721.1 hypothetical protein A1355_15445 [Methylomonas koyamae]OHX38164.1 hypothetical protein BJL95_23440 [Methylomonas sp. LWB]
MSREFYGPKADAESVINQLLSLPATGREQDWEIELADPARIDEMLDILESKDIDFECKSALALLAISSMEEANEAGMLEAAQVRRAYQLFFKRDELRERMCFYWIELGRANNIELVKSVIAC